MISLNIQYYNTRIRSQIYAAQRSYHIILSLVAVVVPASELQLLVAEPEDDVPADQPQAGGFESSIEGPRSL